MDPAEDSDNLARTLAGKVKRTFPRKNEAFENTKSRVRKRIRRQKKVLRLLKAEHKRKFPNENIIDSEDEEWEYLVALRYKVKDGAEMIAARPAAIVGVIVHNDHLEDIDDPDDPTPEDLNAPEAAGKAAADTLWPPL